MSLSISLMTSSNNFLSSSASMENFSLVIFLYSRVCVEIRNPIILVNPSRTVSNSSEKLHMLAFSISFILVGEIRPIRFMKSGTSVEYILSCALRGLPDARSRGGL